MKGITVHTYPDRSPCSSPGALGRQVGGGCALGIRSMMRRAGATVRSWLHLAESEKRIALEGRIRGSQRIWSYELARASLQCAGLPGAVALRCRFSWGRAWPGVPTASGSRSAHRLAVCAS